MLITCGERRGPRLRAFDLATAALRWEVADPGSDCEISVVIVSEPDGVGGIAALPAHGVVIVGCKGELGRLVVRRVTDGAFVASVLCALPDYLAADPTTGYVYASTRGHSQGSHSVSVFRWTGAELERLGSLVDARGNASKPRPLAFVPPAPGKRIAHLVVGEAETSRVRVISLASHKLVHAATLQPPEGVRVSGLAGDPSGKVLAVCHASSVEAARAEVHVLRWPLSGMPPLE